MNQITKRVEIIQERGGIMCHKHGKYDYWHPVTRRHILTSEQANQAIQDYKG